MSSVLEGASALDLILQHLKKSGEAMDFDIAKAVGTPLDEVKTKLAGLAASGEVITCYVMRFEGKKKIEGLSCRISGYIPPASPGRKPKSITIGKGS
jgi:hypothetical protein